jgi:hypothetical protein
MKTILITLQLIVIAGVLGIGCFSAQAQEKPLRVFVLVGQSNMQGHAHVRTLPHIGMDPRTKLMLDEILNDQFKPRVFDNVWISYLSSDGAKKGQLTTGFGADKNKIGPELTFGIYMQKKLNEPILIIKTAWGGKSLHTDFRPPSSGPYEFDELVISRLKEQGKDIDAIKAEKEQASGVYYRQTVEHVKSVLANIKSAYPEYDPKGGYQLAGLVWFQGWNDMVDGDTYPKRGDAGGFDQYSKVLADLIRDLRKDLDAPNLPFVIGVMGVGGPTEKYSPSQQRYKKVHQNFRDAMAAPAALEEFQGNVFAVLTENCWDSELDAILARDAQIQDEIKKLENEGKLEEAILREQDARELTGEELETINMLQRKGKLGQMWLEHRRGREFTDREYQILNQGSSNAAYHYLGCGKIMAQIGMAFADALPVEEGQ